MNIVLQDIDKLSLVKCIQAHEKNGYECTCRIAEKKSICKQFKQDRHKYKNRKYAGVNTLSVFIVKMRKVL